MTWSPIINPRESRGIFPPARAQALQRKCACGQHTGGGEECEECRKENSLQRQKGPSPESTGIPSIVDEVLRSPGRPLDNPTRAFMEARFGHDFSGVRVHTDAKAAESASAVNALAYTVGRDVVFGAGHYMPQAIEGRRLLAHELTHVVQQSANPARPPSAAALALAPAAGQAEAEADAIAGQAIAGDGIRPATRNHEPAIQREEAPGPPKKKEKITLPSGLKIDSGTFFMMLGLCNQGKLDPLYCAEMRMMIEPQPGKSPLGLPSLVPPLGVTPNSGLGPGKSSVPSPFNFKPSMLQPPSVGGPALVPPAKPPAGAPSAAGPGLGDLLTFKFKGGPVEFTLQLPKAVTAKLPLELTRGKVLTFELKGESSGTFSFGVTLDGIPHVRISLKAGVSIDKEKGPIGSGGLEIQLTRKVCKPADPESLKKMITDAGEKLKKAYQELGTAKDVDRLLKLADIAGAIGEMYDAIETAKAGCKETPAATFKFGVQGPLSPDPQHPAPTTLGPSLIFHF